MADTHAISALRRKRAYLAGAIEAAKKALTTQRQTLATLDAVINLFEPQGRPDLIPAIRPASRQCLFFRRGDLTRLCLSALRKAGKPVVTRYVTDYAEAAKGLTVEALVDRRINEHVRVALVRLATKGAVRNIVTWPDVRWELGDIEGGR
jgi:hypothetical protein